MNLRRTSASPWTYIESWLGGRRIKEQFDEVQTYVMFIGQPRSGTSLLGSILNAHPDICVAQELNALRYLGRGYNREQLFWLLLRRDSDFARSGRNWTGYNYSVEGQWQGRTRQLRVIGDKKAGKSSDQLRRRPGLLDKLIRTVRVPLRIIHVVRDPFNVITTVHRKVGITLEKSAENYFRRCEINWQLMQRHGHMIQTFRLEDLIVSPRQHLDELCRFLDVEAPRDYIDACVSLLFEKPRQSKSDCDWPPSLIAHVSRRIEDFPFLAGYAYETAYGALRRAAA